MINFSELSDKEFYNLLNERTSITKYFKRNVIKTFKKYLEVSYPNGTDLETFITNLPDGEEFYKSFGYLGGE